MANPNTLFALINVADASFEAKLKAASPWIYLKITDSEWLLYAPAATTAQEVSDRLGFTGDGSSTGIVLRVDSYFGRHYQTTWDWMKTKQGAEIGVAASPK
jgi:hypothetical protein